MTVVTERQKRLAKEIADNAYAFKPKTAVEMLEDAGYSPILARSSAKRTMQGPGVLEELAKYGFTEENAKGVVAQILADEEIDPTARLKAADMMFKVAGAYAPEKKELSGVIATGPSLSAELIAIAEEELKKRKIDEQLDEPTADPKV
jgi:hypothetical protein